MSTNTTDARLDTLETLMFAIAAKLDIDVPAKPVKAPAKRVTRKPAARTTAKPSRKPVTLTKATRKAFVAAAAKQGWDLEGLSCRQIAAVGFTPKGFVIGEGYKRLVGDA